MTGIGYLTAASGSLDSEVSLARFSESHTRCDLTFKCLCYSNLLKLVRKKYTGNLNDPEVTIDMM